MNLQVCVPYEDCPYNCKMCVARGREKPINFYDRSREFYLEELSRQARFPYNDFIITGATEPTLNSNWLKDVLERLSGKNVELQTKNYNLKNYNLEGIKTLSYSITKPRELSKAWNYRKIEGNNRLVILLTKDFDYLTVDRFSTMGFNQITFKTLQLTADKKTNEYIEQNKMTDLTNIYEIVNKYNGSKVSVRLDQTCQDSVGRYEIFREDGYIYTTWEEELRTI